MRRLLILSLLLAACDHAPPPPLPPRPALVVTAGESGSGASMALVGEVRPRYESLQGFRIAGKIVERKVEVGSAVKKGQVLARLDPADTGLAAQASQADVRAAEADYALAEAELERQRQLYARKFISRSALDIREAQFKTTDARLQQARAQAAVSGNQSRYTALVAERDGVVTEIHAEPGQVVAAGDVVARVAAIGEVEVVIAVPELRMTGVVTGVPAQVWLWVAHDRPYRGKVREVAPAADPVTRTFDVRVSLLDADDRVRLGMTAGVQFANQRESAMLLPIPALTQRNGQTVVWVVDPKSYQVQPRPVRAESYSERGALVSGGLTAGEQVVVAGVHALSPGQVVRPVPAAP
ncbi:MAG TPA: efflux RND transporter periplasmic adaptor subunit [Methylophilaceae bacterium]|nr:efflux RND transporter periplasmic adaptor subunit [Methylophilaceae bacterium]